MTPEEIEEGMSDQQIKSRVSSDEELKTSVETDIARLHAIQEERVHLRHPRTKDVKVVSTKPEELIPLMGEGYQQFYPVKEGE